MGAGVMSRLKLRIAAGVGPHDVGPEVEPMLWRYWATHDPEFAAALVAQFHDVLAES